MNADPSSESPALTAKLDKEVGLDFGNLPDLPMQILRDYVSVGLVGEEANKLLFYLSMSSRKMPRPLSVLVQSSSGAGKSSLQDATLRFCPPEDVVQLTTLSERALFYKEPDGLKHKVLALEEEAGVQKPSYALRNLISAGRLTIEVTVRSGDGFSTLQNTIEGPTAVLLTTTSHDVDAETMSRFVVIGIDESRDQTKAILALQRRQYTIAGLNENSQIKNIQERHWSFQRQLKCLHVINPFADDLMFADDRLQARRCQPQYLNLIAAIAFLRQLQKRVCRCHGVDYIEVDHDDLEFGRDLAAEVLGKNAEELSIPAQNLLELLCSYTKHMANEERVQGNSAHPSDVVFTRRDIREFTGWGKTRLQNHLTELLDLEYVIIQRKGRNNRTQYYRLMHTENELNEKKSMLKLKKN